MRGLKFGGRMMDITALVAAVQSIDSGEFKKDGWDNAEQFVIDGLGYSSYDTFDRHRKTIKSFGLEMTNTLVDCGFGWKELRMVEHVMSEDQKESSRKKNLLIIDDKEIPADDKERVATEVALLIEQRNSARKDARTFKKESDSVKKAHDEGAQPLKQRIEELEALVSPVDTPEHIVEGFARIDKAFGDIETVVRVFAWKEAKKEIAERPEVQARIDGVLARILARAEALREDWATEMERVAGR